ncbi:Aste57867_12291 [Aphanomyces stellatus]|uniref:Aste57867_12291 protein n=1 Tax=Aphanomyces stellatus TaxID=120398 RepID=A0A485KVT5_9STRA|nr:hypothetical protein As57867_012246 [Aphanomyces stellatus]VFT89144.1 Aste57867_12291 [Aphanomyces stellatus]
MALPLILTAAGANATEEQNVLLEHRAHLATLFNNSVVAESNAPCQRVAGGVQSCQWPSRGPSQRICPDDGTWLDHSFAGECCAVYTSTRTNQIAHVVGADVHMSVEKVTWTICLPCSVLHPPSQYLHPSVGLPPPAPFSPQPRRRHLLDRTPHNLPLAVVQHVSIWPCLIVHGLGYTGGPTTPSDEKYWGNIHAPCCSSVHFALDKVAFGWVSTPVAEISPAWPRRPWIRAGRNGTLATRGICLAFPTGDVQTRPSCSCI